MWISKVAALIKGQRLFETWSLLMEIRYSLNTIFLARKNKFTWKLVRLRYAMFLSDLPLFSFLSSNNTLLGLINIDTRCYKINKVNRSLNILFLLKRKFNASKKRSKQTYEMKYMPVILPQSSSTWFWFLQAMIKHY